MNQQASLSDKLFLSVLDHCIDKAIHSNAIIENTKKQAGVDYLAYQDALWFLSNMTGSDGLTTRKLILDNERASLQRWEPAQESPLQHPDLVIAYHEYLVLALPFKGDKFKQISRLLGVHNTVNSQDYLLKGRDIHILIPFEFIALAHKELVPKHLTAREFYLNQPFSPAFHLTLMPAAVAGLVIEKDMAHTQAYVVHTDALIKELTIDPKLSQKIQDDPTLLDELRAATQHDTCLAAKILKHRYEIAIDDAYIERMVDFDQALNSCLKTHGMAFVDY